MNKSQQAKLKQIADEVIGVPTMIEATSEPMEAVIHTNQWQLPTEKLDRLREIVAVTAISFDEEGGEVTLKARMSESKLRTRAEVKRAIRAQFPSFGDEVIDAMATLNLTDEEQMADLRKRYPHTSEEALLKYAKDEETIAHSVLDGDIEEGMWQAQIDEDIDNRKEENEWIPEF